MCEGEGEGGQCVLGGARGGEGGGDDEAYVGGRGRRGLCVCGGGGAQTPVGVGAGRKAQPKGMGRDGGR